MHSMKILFQQKLVKSSKLGTQRQFKTNHNINNYFDSNEFWMMVLRNVKKLRITETLSQALFKQLQSECI